MVPAIALSGRRVGRVAVVGMLLLVACRGGSPSAQSVDERQLSRLVDSLMPPVAKATGLAFKSTPKSAVRSREQIHQYLIAKLGRELPSERLDGIAATYRLLGMVPDTLDLRRLVVDLYTEQIAGFFDPDSATLFAVAGADPAQLRLVLAHELVHALQDQYLALDSILHDASDGDRQTAAQAVLEGQATLASIVALVPGMDVIGNDAFWSSFRQQLRAQQAGTTVFARAPMVIREGLVFPYLDGAEFVRWFDRAHPGETPYGSRMPASTEEILHPERYARGDAPVAVRFRGDTAGVEFEDTFGELDVDLLLATLQQAASVRTDSALGWGGDRLRIYRSPGGPALVWATVWDDSAAAAGFRRTVGAAIASRPRPGYRVSASPITGLARPGVRIVIAPVAWTGWKSLPTAELR